jgi:type I restriction enzyme M protein
MPIKKSELYSSLWASCDQLRGGMDASQYKDYVLVMLFIKYVSDKYAGVPYAPITVPKGASFRDMVNLKGKSTIGDDINKKILGPIGAANKISDLPDFNDVSKLGSGNEMVMRLTNLIAIFEKPELDFSQNKSEGDDILGDAYEYLMRHFATESGKSKGQFYTPAEVSRVIAKIIGIDKAKVTSETSAYDPAGGSGSLLLKVADHAERSISLYLQEMDVATAALARMNMILHNNPTAVIKQGNTMANPMFTDNSGNLKTFDYVVANPPFSYKSWSNGVDPVHEPWRRFQDYGIPPAKNGDYAFLLHIIRSIKSKGKGACILPHGVLFRGNAEAVIRKNIIEKKYIKGIIGLPSNLFYGTGIPACIIVLDKENAAIREGIFMIDASKGFIKDGPKNRLREQDIHKIVDIFNKQLEVPKFSRMVPFNEISDPKNDYNLNIPRYIDSQEPEDIQDIEAHLLGDIPEDDIAALKDYWEVYPSLQNVLFSESDRIGYLKLTVSNDKIKLAILTHPEFETFNRIMDEVFKDWKTRNSDLLKELKAGARPKQVIQAISEDILNSYSNRQLLDKYDLYQHLMNYWNEVMQDDIYLIAADGWKAEPIILKQTKKEAVWNCDLVPKKLVIDRYFKKEKEAVEQLEAEKASVTARIEEMAEEHSSDDGYFADLEKLNKANLLKRLKEVEGEVNEEINVLTTFLDLLDQESGFSTRIKEATAELDKKAFSRYKTFSEEDIKTLVVDDKWMASVESSMKSEMERISQRLTQRIKELAERYETPLPKLTTEVADLEARVTAHLQKMGFVWK